MSEDTDAAIAESEARHRQKNLKAELRRLHTETAERVVCRRLVLAGQIDRLGRLGLHAEPSSNQMIRIKTNAKNSRGETAAGST